METKKYLKIDEILQTKRITLHDLSDKTGIRTENLHTILKKNTSIDTLKRIANALDYRLEDLVKQKISAHGYISCIIKGVKDNKILENIEDINSKLRSTIKKIRNLNLQINEINILDKFIEIVEKKEYNIDDVVYAINIKNNSRTTKQNVIIPKLAGLSDGPYAFRTGYRDKTVRNRLCCTL